MGSTWPFSALPLCGMTLPLVTGFAVGIPTASDSIWRLLFGILKTKKYTTNSSGELRKSSKYQSVVGRVLHAYVLQIRG